MEHILPRVRRKCGGNEGVAARHDRHDRGRGWMRSSSTLAMSLIWSKVRYLEKGDDPRLRELQRQKQ